MSLARRLVSTLITSMQQFTPASGVGAHGGGGSRAAKRACSAAAAGGRMPPLARPPPVARPGAGPPCHGQPHHAQVRTVTVASASPTGQTQAGNVAATTAPPPFDPEAGGVLRVGLADLDLPEAGGDGLPPAGPPGLAPPKRLRLDAFLAARCPGLSRARLAAAIRAGAVRLNGAPAPRPGAALRVGDSLTLAPLPPLPPLAAAPEEIPLAIVHEDAHLIVVNKAPGVVVHPAPGALTGTLVAGLLFHVQREAAERAAERGGAAALSYDSGNAAGPPVGPEDGEEDEAEEEEEEGRKEQGAPRPSFARPISLLDAAAVAPSPSTPAPSHLRPGIVHRLDRGTSGLLVVAKSAAAHENLSNAFAARQVRRVYVSLTIGVPDPPGGTVRTNVGRDPADRTRMTAFPYGGVKGLPAVSDFRVVEVLGGGAAAVVEWRLRTGRTHQIRVHARHIGHPLVGDGTYGGAGSGAVAGLAARAVGRGGGAGGRRGGGPALAAARAAAGGALAALALAAEAEAEAEEGRRPALHARSLGFTHPVTGEDVDFEVAAPPDFEAAAAALRGL